MPRSINIRVNQVIELRHGWTSAQELRHKFRKISLTSAHVILLHRAEITISIELGAEVNIRCRSPLVGAEVTSVSKLLVLNIDCPVQRLFKTNWKSATSRNPPFIKLWNLCGTKLMSHKLWYLKLMWYEVRLDDAVIQNVHVAWGFPCRPRAPLTTKFEL